MTPPLLGLPEGLPVIATAHDKAVEGPARLGSPRTRRRFALSLGTYIAAMAHGARHVADADSFWTFPASLPGQHLYECWGPTRDVERQLVPRRVRGGGRRRRCRCWRAGGGTAQRRSRHVPVGSDGLLTIHDWAAPPYAPFRKGA